MKNILKNNNNYIFNITRESTVLLLIYNCLSRRLQDFSNLKEEVANKTGRGRGIASLYIVFIYTITLI
jgi:hypothetical protein